MNITSMKFIDSAINVYVEEDYLYLLDDVFGLFSTHFEFCSEPSNDSIVDFRVYPVEYFPKRGLKLSGRESEDIIMRTSSSEKFRLNAKHYNIDGLDIYDCKNSQTIMVFDKKNKNIDIYATKDSDIQLIELIRDLIIKDQENKGMLILHASAAVKDEKAVVVVGSKGAGKSTTLMELLLSKGYKMVSGDKVFLKVENDTVMMKGWPDYPHLGLGTIRRHAKLYDMVKKYYDDNIDNEPANKKILINPSLFERESGIEFAKGSYLFEKVLFPQLSENEESYLVRLENPQTDEITANLEFKGDYAQTRWNKYITLNYENREENIMKLREAIKKSAYYILGGNLKITDSMLKELML